MKTIEEQKNIIQSKLSHAGRVIAARRAAKASGESESSNGKKTTVRTEYAALVTENQIDRDAVAFAKLVDSLNKQGVNLVALAAAAAPAAAPKVAKAA